MTPPRAGPVCTPGARLAGFIKMTLIHTCSYTQNKKSLGLMVLEKSFLYAFPFVSLWELMNPGAGPILTTQGHGLQDL